MASKRSTQVIQGLTAKSHLGPSETRGSWLGPLVLTALECSKVLVPGKEVVTRTPSGAGKQRCAGLQGQQSGGVQGV